MYQMLCGYRISSSIYVAAKLGIADLLKDGPKSSDELAKSAEVDPDALHRVLRALASLGVFAQVDQGRFALTPLGALLQRDVPDSLWEAAILDGELRWPVYGELLYSVRTGRPAHDHVFSMGVFENLAQHPETVKLLNLSWLRHGFASNLGATYDFSGIRALVDVGGGRGQSMVLLLKANPMMRGIILDLPYVIDDARAFVESEGLAQRCEVVSGDFFASVPPGGDAYLLRWILHDWDDAHAVAILKNCRRATEGRGKLLVLDRVVPERAEQDPAVFLGDLEMLVFSPGGRERTEAEFRSLFGEAGFKLKDIIPTNWELSIVEGAPV
jgi:hypothetical protein